MSPRVPALAKFWELYEPRYSWAYYWFTVFASACGIFMSVGAIMGRVEFDPWQYVIVPLFLWQMWYLNCLRFRHKYYVYYMAKFIQEYVDESIVEQFERDQQEKIKAMRDD